MTKLVLITGTGRSGTSTMSGTLHHLGLHVPGPYLGANESNPKGFFESKWAVTFHKRITAAAGINDFDSRPDRLRAAREAVTARARGRSWASSSREQPAEHDQVVVKDPRPSGRRRCGARRPPRRGCDIRYISMLRHPAEVVGSRATYYAKSEDPEDQRGATRSSTSPAGSTAR